MEHTTHTRAKQKEGNTYARVFEIQERRVCLSNKQKIHTIVTHLRIKKEEKTLPSILVFLNISRPLPSYFLLLAIVYLPTATQYSFAIPRRSPLQSQLWQSLTSPSWKDICIFTRYFSFFFSPTQCSRVFLFSLDNIVGVRIKLIFFS